MTTRPPHELLLAQLILSSAIVSLVGHATYEKDLAVPHLTFEWKKGELSIRRDGHKTIVINEFRVASTTLFLLTVSSAYFFVNLVLYCTNKILKEPILNKTILILMQDVVFCFLMLACGTAAIARPGERVTGTSGETEILIAAGISFFCSISSGVGVYYSYRVYKGL